MRISQAVGDADRPAFFLPDSFLRFGSLEAVVRTDDAQFRERFHRVFQDCIAPGGTDGARRVELEVRAADHTQPVSARISGHEGAGAASVLARIFPELVLVDAGVDRASGWRIAARAGYPEPVAAFSGERLLIDRALPWQIVLAHYFIDHLMRLQPEWAFFHAATLAIGEEGVLLSGNKGAGKSTLALALAARGHGFLGDEIAAIHLETGAIAPFPRAVSIRAGPQAREVQDYIGRVACEREQLADGTERIRMPVSRIFPRAAPRAVTLGHAFFLEPRAPAAHARAFDFSASDLCLVGPLHATLPAGSGGTQVVRFLRVFGGVRCFRLSPGGTPDDTAELIERIVEGKWDTPSRKGRNASGHSAGSRSN